MISPARRVGRTTKLPNRRQFEEARVELNALSAEELVNSWQEPKKKVHRLVLSAERKYQSVPTPPSPALSPVA